MNTLSIGLLLPNSSIFPMGKQFEKGLKETLSAKDTGISFEFFRELIGQGGVTQTENCLTKLLTYEDVDVVTGILSNKVAEKFSARFKGTQKPFLLNNLGENIPGIPLFNEYVFISSFNLWQHAWSLGYWGVNTFGKKGMYVSSVYDAGYSFSHMFHEGMKAADISAEWSFSVAPLPAPGSEADVSVVFPFIEQYQPDFIFATFCGSETTLFLNEFIKRGWHTKIKLLGLPFLLEPFQALPDNITIYTTSPSAGDVTLSARDIFYFMGKQTAALICNAMLANNSVPLNERLQEIPGIHGNNNCMEYSVNNSGNLVVVENIITKDNTTFASAIINETPTFPLHRYAEVASVEMMGWNNPYLCV